LEYSSLPDQLLTQYLQNGDPDAFREIYSRYWEKLYRSVYGKLKNREAAQEVVQNIFVRCWEKRTELAIENLGHYLQSAAKFAVIDVYRCQMRDAKYWQHAQIFQSQADSSTEKQIELQDLMQAIETGLTRMPVKTQQIFTLNRLENQSVPEISKILKMPSRTIEYHITQGLRLLRLHLKDFVPFVITVISFLA